MKFLQNENGDYYGNILSQLTAPGLFFVFFGLLRVLLFVPCM